MALTEIHNPSVLTETAVTSLVLEAEYRSFLNWWEKNHYRFDDLSFNINNQISLFLDSAKEEGVDTAFSQLRMDLYGYYLEYIRQQAILPFTLRFDEDYQLIGDFYGKKPLREMINPEEREGALKEGIVDLEKKLKILSSGQMILRVSPLGWTNLGYEFDETQSQIFWKENGNIRGLTLRSNISLDEIIGMFQSLGINLPDDLSDKEKIKRIVRENIELPSDFNIEDLIEKYFLFDHRGESLAPQYQQWLRQDGVFASYDEIREMVDFVEERIRKLINEGYSDGAVGDELKIILSFALMMMMMGNQMKDEMIFPHQKVEFSADTVFLPPAVYDRVFNKLQSLPGCAGFGSSSLVEGMDSLSIMTPFGPVKVSESEEKVLKCVHCPFCGKTVDAQIITKDDGQYIHCPECGQSASFNSRE